MPDLEDLIKHLSRSRSRDFRTYRSRRHERGFGSSSDLHSLVRRLKKAILFAAVSACLLLLLLSAGVVLLLMNASAVRSWAVDAWEWSRGVATQAGTQAKSQLLQPEQLVDEKVSGLDGVAREWGMNLPSISALNSERLATIGAIKVLSDHVLSGLNVPAADLSAARAEVDRVIQGLSDGRIVDSSVIRLTESLYTTDAHGNRVLRTLDAASLQRLIDDTRRLADAAGVEPATEHQSPIGLHVEHASTASGE